MYIVLHGYVEVRLNQRLQQRLALEAAHVVENQVLDGLFRLTGDGGVHRIFDLQLHHSTAAALSRTRPRPLHSTHELKNISRIRQSSGELPTKLLIQNMNVADPVLAFHRGQ